MLDFLLAFLSGILLGGAVAYFICWIGYEPERDKARAWDRAQRAKASAVAVYGLRGERGFNETNEPNGNPV